LIDNFEIPETITALHNLLLDANSR